MSNNTQDIPRQEASGETQDIALKVGYELHRLFNLRERNTEIAPLETLLRSPSQTLFLRSQGQDAIAATLQALIEMELPEEANIAQLQALAESAPLTKRDYREIIVLEFRAILTALQSLLTKEAKR